MHSTKKECLKEIQQDWPSVKRAGSKNNYELLPKAKINWTFGQLIFFWDGTQKLKTYECQML